MKRARAVFTALLVIALQLVGCSQMPAEADEGWITLFDGTDLNNFDRVGKANWRLVDRVVQADNMGGGDDSYLITKNTYTDFQIRAEIWVDDQANSGILIRMSDRKNITPFNSYEVNIFDKRPDPDYGTGAIVNFAKVSPMPKAAGRWNVLDITAKGSHLIVVLNGIKTADIHDSTFSSGPFALQYWGGVVKFRNVRVKPL
ncbi:MAG: 3-keto-disaccharide hydrolase [Burkholderiales bacterium]